jgi:hypothetical protein
VKTVSINKIAGLSSLRETIKGIAKISNRSYLSICDEIGGIIDKSGDTIQDWLQNSSIHKWRVADLNSILFYCMSHSMDLDRNWAIIIFSSFGYSESSFSDELKDLIYHRDASLSKLSSSSRSRINIHDLVSRFIDGIQENSSRCSPGQCNFQNSPGFFSQ